MPWVTDEQTSTGVSAEDGGAKPPTALLALPAVGVVAALLYAFAGRAKKAKRAKAKVNRA